jgi:RimJ/RimL family protein N-acetyltransferase
VINPVLLDIPTQFETERLLLRAPQPGDGVQVYGAVKDSIVELRAWPASLPWAQGEPSIEASEIFCRTGAAAYLAHSDFPLLALSKDEGLLVGLVGLHHVDWSVPRMEVGYWGRTPYLGQGWMTEAVRGVSNFALNRLGVRRLEIRTDSQNHRSRGLAERAGFRLEGVLHKERVHPDGRLLDTCLYAVTA